MVSTTSCTSQDFINPSVLRSDGCGLVRHCLRLVHAMVVSEQQKLSVYLTERSIFAQNLTCVIVFDEFTSTSLTATLPVSRSRSQTSSLSLCDTFFMLYTFVLIFLQCTYASLLPTATKGRRGTLRQGLETEKKHTFFGST